MDSITYRNRRAVSIENDHIRVIATVEGGHLAEILHKPTNVNPLWTPPWPSIEPSTYNRQQYPEYGFDDEAPLLAGILGHNICLDTFGAPSPEEAAAGMPVHGEAPVAPYQVSGGDKWINLEATLPKAQLRFNRRISIAPDSMVLRISEELENLSPTDRPVAWTQHVTMGPPFLKRRQTQFAITATESKVIDSNFNGGKGMQQSGAKFNWPFCPMKDGRTTDLRVFTADQVSGGFTAHLMDTGRKQAHFFAWSPVTKVLFGYVWNRADFPWLARWEENHIRTQPPWNGEGLACAMEFGVSPFVESRRQMVDRGSLFGVPGFRWLPARTRAQVNYCAFITTSDSMPESVVWDGEAQVAF
jgi:hypothetical protein